MACVPPEYISQRFLSQKRFIYFNNPLLASRAKKVKTLYWQSLKGQYHGRYHDFWPKLQYIYIYLG